jgi:hypothetical protein
LDLAVTRKGQGINWICREYDKRNDADRNEEKPEFAFHVELLPLQRRALLTRLLNFVPPIDRAEMLQSFKRTHLRSFGFPPSGFISHAGSRSPMRVQETLPSIIAGSLTV